MHISTNFKKYILLIPGLLLFQLSIAQENFIKGYVVKNNSDTLHGFIDYRNWGVNPKQIQFKSTIESDPITFNPLDIVEFKASDDVYVGGIVDVETTLLKIDKLEEDNELRIVQDTLFLRVLSRGDKSLYYHKNIDDRRNFYILTDNGYDLLVYKKYIKRIDGKPRVTENRKYLGQLTLYLNDCDEINKAIEKTSYNQNSLLSLFHTYYKCSSSEQVILREKEKVKLQWGILAGLSHTKVNFSSDIFDYLVDAKFDNSTNPAYGLFFDVVLPRNNAKWSIYNEILYSTYEVNGIFEEFESENDNSTTTTEIGSSNLNIHNSIRYRYPFKNFNWFLNLGISTAFILSDTNYRRERITFFSAEDRIVEGLAIGDTRKMEQALFLGTGIQMNDFSFEFRYKSGNGMSNLVSLSSRTNSFFMLVGYRF